MQYIYTVEYYLVIRMNGVGSFVEMGKDLESVRQTNVRKIKANIVY